jgi:hypothetical protein
VSVLFWGYPVDYLKLELSLVAKKERIGVNRTKFFVAVQGTDFGAGLAVQAQSSDEIGARSNSCKTHQREPPPKSSPRSAQREKGNAINHTERAVQYLDIKYATT